MYRTASGDAVAMHRSLRSQQRSAPAEFIATARRGELAAAAQPLPRVEDSRSFIRRASDTVAAAAPTWLIWLLMVTWSLTLTGFAVAFAVWALPVLRGWLA